MNVSEIIDLVANIYVLGHDFQDKALPPVLKKQDPCRKQTKLSESEFHGMLMAAAFPAFSFQVRQTQGKRLRNPPVNTMKSPAAARKNRAGLEFRTFLVKYTTVLLNP
jgi:hypothetical protein